MPSFRLYPLLALGATCLTLSACGGDDDPSAQAGATDSSTAAAPATTTATQAAPATTEPSTDAEGGADAGTDGSSKASSSETAKVRGALISLQEAFAAKDGKKACSYMIGVPEKSDPKVPGGISCEALGQGAKFPMSEENRKIAETAKVTIDGNSAIAELGPGMPMELRKIDGRWRVDYTKLVNPAGSSR